MKKIKFLVFAFVLGFTALPTNIAQASENNVTKEKTQFRATIEEESNNNEISEVEAIEISEGMFEELEDTDKVIELPKGGYLIGGASLMDPDNPEVVLEKYDSETDKNAITVEEAKEEVVEELLDADKHDNLSIQPRRITPTTERYRLDKGALYVSDCFQAKGWRFSGYQFYPESGTGSYLRWRVFFDSGVVGTFYDGLNCNQHRPYGGRAIYPEEGYVWIDTGGSGDCNKTLIYFTYNPIPGNYYTVANREPGE